MSKFNTVSTGTKTSNLAGGQAYKQTPELELISTLVTSFASGSYYETESNERARLIEIIKQSDKLFAAKAAIYARNEYGMRSITHILASEIAKHISGQPWAKSFYERIIRRPDDITEIIAYHHANNGKLSSSMKKGLAAAFDKFDTYSLAKYRGENKTVKLIDAVNLCHPVPTDKNRDAIKALVTGDLKSFDTWEVELSKSGLSDDVDAAKDTAWSTLIESKKIGYFALLRNLRNIITQSPKSIDAAIAMLTDRLLIMRSLVLPFRYITAFEEVVKLMPSTEAQKVLQALNTAVDLSLSNVPIFNGTTLVVLDVSGSMVGKPAVIGSIFSAALIKNNRADFISFSDNAKYTYHNPMDSTITIANNMNFASGGTNFHSIFQTASKKYDRIIILSDMQGWIGHHSPVSAFSEYKTRTGADPYIYSMDLKNTGTMQFPEKNVFCLAGFSEKIFDIMSIMEQDKNALINTINQISL